MPERCPVEFCRKVLDLIEAGKPVDEIAEQLGMTAQTGLADYLTRAATRSRTAVIVASSSALTASRKALRTISVWPANTRWRIRSPSGVMRATTPRSSSAKRWRVIHRHN